MAGVRKNAIANAAGLAWNAFLTLAVVPVQLHFLGVEAYGLIGFLTSLQLVIAVLDLGLSTTANRELARRAASPASADEARSLVRTLEIVYGVIGVAIAGALALASHWIATGWIVTRDLPPESVRLAIVIFGVTLAIRWPVALYTGVLRGLERQVELNWISAGAVTARSLGGVAVLAFVSPTVTALLWWMLAAGLIEVVALAVAAWRAMPGGSGVRARFQGLQLRSVWKFTASVTAITLFAAVLKQMDKLLLGALLPLEQMGYYTAGVVASRGLLYIPTAMFNAVFPRFSALASEGESEALGSIYHKASQVVAFTVAPLACLLMFFPHDVLRIWTRSEAVATHGGTALSLLALATLFNAMMQVPFALQLASGMTWLPLWNNGLSALLLGPCIVVLVMKWGIAGAAASWAAFNVVYYATVPAVMHRKVLRGHLSRWLLGDTLPFMAAGVAIFGGLSFMTLGWSNRYLVLGIAAAGGLAYAGLMLALHPTLRGSLGLWSGGIAPAARIQPGDELAPP